MNTNTCTWIDNNNKSQTQNRKRYLLCKNVRVHSVCNMGFHIPLLIITYIPLLIFLQYSVQFASWNCDDMSVNFSFRNCFHIIDKIPICINATCSEHVIIGIAIRCWILYVCLNVFYTTFIMARKLYILKMENIRQRTFHTSCIHIIVWCGVYW